MFLIKNKCLLFDLLGVKDTPPLDLISDSPNVKTSNLDKLPVYILLDRKEKSELNYEKKSYKNSLKYNQSKQRTQTNIRNNTR